MYLVTGATGQLGCRIVRKLREQNLPVRAFVRLSARYTELEARGAQIFIGDLRHGADIRKACQGVTAIISTHSASRAQSLDEIEAVDYRANMALIDQAQVLGIEHFTFISVLGADRRYEDAPIFKAKAAVEHYLQASGVSFTILRPAGLASNLLSVAEQFRRTGIYWLIGDPQNRTSIVSTDDLAQIAATSHANPGAHQQVLAVGGPEILHRGDIPKLMGQLFDREPWVLNLPLLAVDGVRNILGWVNPPAQSTLGTFRTLLAHEFFCTPEETEQIQSLYDIPLESLEHFLKRYLSI
ncbi:NAD(P)H-binding protein [Synechococcales cyanobacterium C]|uniref:NAD(P)H-binding protein n=1 Tax=Petrachloros mirabilis ULC683 TaxID=2781853 RepID=A0A8K1ZWQ9_9CYAN|nr:NAD(P)H-binding protein [Petrachloros mirabilis]NCJ05297.1 NAD(P)H-binding protein [Petrachloros mirabilis ULC683]